MNIELNEQEMHFLKEFASKQYEGARDNVETRTPIHVVERKQVEFVETEDEGECWCCDSLEGQIFDNIQDLLDAAVENDLVTLERLDALAKESFYCEPDSLENCCSIDEQKEFLRMVSIEARFGREVNSYTPVAFFLIRDEAVRYKDGYQEHNCADCRIYTYGLGYSNNGDMPVFRNLLMRMGRDLLESEKWPDLDIEISEWVSENFENADTIHRGGSGNLYVARRDGELVRIDDLLFRRIRAGQHIEIPIKKR